MENDHPDRASVAYWLLRTPSDRIAEVERLRREKWGDAVGEPIRRDVFEILTLDDLGKETSDDQASTDRRP